jgi:hypothetical protein
MEIFDVIKIIKDGSSRESDNAKGELLRRTSLWKDSNKTLSSSIFTHICHKYNVHRAQDSLNEMESIYYESIVRIINNIEKGNLDNIKTLNAFEAYSKMICANVCREWIKIQYKGGMKQVPVYLNINKAYLIRLGEGFVRDNEGNLKIFENENQAIKYRNENTSGTPVAIRSINSKDILDQVEHLIHGKLSYAEIPVDDVLKNETSDELSYYEEKILQEFVGVHQNKVSKCRNIFELSAIYVKTSEQHKEWQNISGNEGKTYGAYRKKKSDCKQKLINEIKNSEHFLKSDTFMDFVDVIYGDINDDLQGDSLFACSI